ARATGMLDRRAEAAIATALGRPCARRLRASALLLLLPRGPDLLAQCAQFPTRLLELPLGARPRGRALLVCRGPDALDLALECRPALPRLPDQELRLRPPPSRSSMLGHSAPPPPPAP